MEKKSNWGKSTNLKNLNHPPLIEPEANAFEAQSNVNHEAQFEAQFEAQSNVNHEAQSNVEHEAQFEAQSNVDELNSDEGDSSVVSLDDSDDEHILDGEIFIDEVVHEVVHYEPKKKSKNKGGRPKKHIVTDPKGKGTVWSNNDIEESDHELSDDMSLNIVKKRKRTKTVLEESDHDSSELDTENDESDDGTKVHYPPFVIPKKMEGYKWVKGTTFSTREEFKEAISTYAVTNNRDLRYIKNDNERVRVGCKDGCPFVALLSKVPGEDTWQLRTLNDEHKCMPEYRVKRLNANWLGKKLVSSVRENPNIKLTDICTKAHEKWRAGVSRLKAYRARKSAIDLVDGSFKEQYKRLYDYGHEIIRSNPNSTLQIQVQPTEQVVEGDEDGYVIRPLLPSFKRIYMCLEGCKQSFFRCRPFIGLDGCFLKGYYGGMILAVVGRDPNDQMLPIALAVVESETRDSWSWFLELLINDLGGQQVDLKPHQQSGITSPSRMLLELNEPDIWKREFDPLERREAIDFGISIPGFSIWEVNGFDPTTTITRGLESFDVRADPRTLHCLDADTVPITGTNTATRGIYTKPGVTAFALDSPFPTISPGELWERVQGRVPQPSARPPPLGR
ncbi:hypothetical protein TSUD_31810 [Trifolium subterraneum]|uniref:MULE transposase domain-containing protein n=1 Tax=Trifolium subterraneum TaxID=3900 RepID=A0A2Z6M9T9_TRISU|nr:hypothetical protein TSUD_31810 [Trifolium subterraneum]